MLDNQHEFFVRRTRASSAALASGSNAGGAEPSDRAGSNANQAGPSSNDAYGDVWEPSEWHTGFEVDAAALPPGINADTAHAALFIGKAVRVLKHAQATHVSSAEAAAGDGTAAFASTLHRLAAQPDFPSVELKRAVEGMRAHVSADESNSTLVKYSNTVRN